MVANDEAITKFLNEFPEADVQLLRNLVRNTRKETELAKPPKSYRELFQAIKAILDARNVAPDVI
jgi:ribosome-associated protein